MKKGPLLLVVPLLFLLSACTLGRMVIYQFSDIKDYKRFPSRPLEAGATPFIFPSQPNDDFLETISVVGGEDTAHKDLDRFLPNTKTVAFLVIHRDTIRYENYFEGYNDTAWVASFSMAKSFTSALAGIAVEEGHISSIDDPITKYIPEMKSQVWQSVTVKHVLEMTTGVKHQENYFNPFAGVARSYYGRHLERQVHHLKQERPAGERWGYKSINTQLLGEIVVRATGRNLTDYLQEKIWTPLGMEHPASWSLDQRRNGREKAFCCLNATARDFAKFGRLYLHNGNWEGQQVVPEDWVKASTELNSEEGSYWGYGYQWWIPSKDGAYAAEGHLGQFIYVHPAHDLVIVRLGQNYGGVRWYPVFAQIAAQYP